MRLANQGSWDKLDLDLRTKATDVLLALQLGKAIDHLHKVGYAHRDIALRNVLVHYSSPREISLKQVLKDDPKELLENSLISDPDHPDLEECLFSRELVQNLLKEGVKTLNVRRFRALLTDFGLSMKPGEFNKSTKGPLVWMAPEAFRRDFPVNEKSDAFMYGITLLEALLGRDR